MLFCFTVLPFNIALARAGGGGGGGGAGGGAGIYGGFYGNSLINILTIFALVVSGGVILFIRVHIKGAIAKKAMKHIAKMDKSWNYKEFRTHIKKMFYTIENAWMKRNQEIAKDYLSKSLYEQYQAESKLMIIRHEKNILEDIHLIEAIPIDVEDNEGDTNDYIWVYIKARMVDYMVDDRVTELQTDSNDTSSFIEYWKLIKENGNWVLDEIKQKDELDLSSL